jgi:signal transduction histidine kinase
MKIKQQFRHLLLAVTVIPLLCAVFLPVYHYFTSPERILIKGYRQIIKLDELSLSEYDRKRLYQHLLHMPPDMEVALIQNHARILLSTIPELKTQTTMTDVQFWNFFRTTSKQYFYQISSPLSNNSSEDLIVLSRAPYFEKERRRNTNIVYSSTIFLFVFAIICIVAIMHISHTIFSSITILEQKTQRIAAGDLSVSLVDPKQTKKQSNEIISLTESLDKMRRSLLDAQERRTKFIMGISHDLRTPVAVIKGYTEAIADKVISDPVEIKKSLDIIGTKTNQLENMINTLINFVKLDNTDWRQNLIPENIREVVEEFGKSAEMTGTVFKRNVTYSIDISTDTRVPMDKQLVQRALENLLSNALRYTKDNDSITITASETADYVFMTVKDSGIGIAEKDMDHIFDLFYRGTNSRREEGMGIGLSVVKNIIDTHGWTISVQSELGRGTAFTITIPKKQNTKAKIPETQEKRSETAFLQE